MNTYLNECLNEHKKIFDQINRLERDILDISEMLQNVIKNGNKILICGNGGSAADAQHMAAEFVGRFEIERKALPAIALTTDSSVITSISNDYEFSQIFTRQIEAFGKKNDCLLCFSTSGNSKNILSALNFCKNKEIKTIGFFGNKGGLAKLLCNKTLIIDSNNTARIQEAHIFLFHIISGLTEKGIFENSN